jgi:hypothetical protein
MANEFIPEERKTMSGGKALKQIVLPGREEKVARFSVSSNGD